MRSLRADEVIDYTVRDFTADRAAYDVVFDAVGKLSFRRCRRALAPGGLFMSADLGFLCQNPLLALLTARTSRRRVAFPTPEYRKQDVLFLRTLLESGEYDPVIDRCYPLEQIVEATRYVETERKTGDVVVSIAPSDPG
ncbi:MAG: zinc-binding dehydrogenase [Jatrophihabitans sp.]